jgi:hypothetical protein
MAKFRVETPNGTYEVEAPEGTTEEQIKAEIAKTQEIENRPEINKFAEGARKVASGATFQFADEGEAYLRSRNSNERLTTTDDYKAAYEEYKTLPVYHKRNEQQKARGLELSKILQNQKKIKNDEVDAKQDADYRQIRDQLRSQSKEFERQNPKLAMGLEIAGGLATPAFGMGALKGASTLAKIGGGAAQGALFGGLFGAGSAKEKEDMLGDAAKNAAIGGVTGGLFSGIGSAIAPKVQKGAEKLLRKGVPLTPGSAFGGAIDTVEQRAGTFMPGVNKMRTKAIKKWNSSIIDDVLNPLGIKVGRTVDDDITELVLKGQKALSKSYDDVLPMISMKADDVLNDDLARIIKKQVLGKDAQRKVMTEMKKIRGYISGNQVSGQSIKQMQEHLGKRIQAYAGTTNADDKAVGEILKDTLDTFMDTVERQNPKYADKLKTINRAYAKFVRIEGASAKLNGAEAFTPKQFGQAVRQADRSTRKRAVAAGNALMQDVGENAQILGNKVPDSGTAGNLITNNLLLGTAGGAGMGLISPWMIAIPGFSKMLYSDSGIKLFNKWLQSGQSRKALREMVKKYSGTATSGLLTLQD